MTAKQFICLKQMKHLEYEDHIKYEQIFFKTYIDIIETF